MQHLSNSISQTGEEWIHQNEGQLLVDVIETQTEVMVRSAIAGVSSEELDISLSEDTLTIRGERSRHCQESEQDTVHVQECHWGAFSRSIILPSHVDPDSAEASLKQGVLTIKMKKAEVEKKISVLEIEDL